MSGGAGWLVTLIGAILAVAVLRDVFHTLWRPTGRGEASRWVTAGLWRLARRIDVGGRVVSVTGPLALAMVAALWTMTMILGWALIYWPHLPGGFSYSSDLNPAQRTGFLDALYLSAVTVATLGFGDIVPADGWLRIAAPLEALIGFALLTAVVSWISQVYPAVTRRRTLALRLAILRRAGHPADRFGPTMTASLLTSLAADVTQVRVDLNQHAEAYYFHDAEDDTSLAAMAGYAADLAVQGQMSASVEVRTGAALLGRALEDFTRVLNREFLRLDTDDAMTILHAYATDRRRRLA
ncbi:potassium channel family protein [Streptomyces sp. 378]|uniref:potassium channel family protein n=1 Tax=Streptomyces sp. 378 TaxID=3049412 RepID=UPI0024C414D0|nr:potassium channel family protein [Streptomyces sp. 378]MDK1342794.1 potassium channel family protein [Streptomyces sp. 378]